MAFRSKRQWSRLYRSAGIAVAIRSTYRRGATYRLASGLADLPTNDSIGDDAKNVTPQGSTSKAVRIIRLTAERCALKEHRFTRTS
jgi:hypothetical protein